MQTQSHKKPYPKNRKRRKLQSYICQMCGYNGFTRANNRRKYCDKCQPLAAKKTQKEWWFSNHKEHLRNQRNNAYKHRYGITIATYDVMLKKQNYCCKMCGCEYIKFAKRLHIDHDHKTGIVRGLLCNTCNTHLGWYESNKDNIVKYLESLK